MFLLKKILESFVLPPGMVVVILAALAVYLWKRERKAAVVCAVLSAVIWAGTSKVFSDELIKPLELVYALPDNPRGDAIVLLCGGFRGGGRPYSSSERLAPGTLERSAAAYKLYKDTGLPIVVSGGAPFSSEPESEAAAAWLKELGVPDGKLTVEKASRDTRENADLTMKLCGEKGYKRIILVTSAYHMPRSVLLFAKSGASDLVPFPVARRSGGPLYVRDWLPGSGVVEARLALNEYLGLAWYRLYFAFF